MIVKLFEVPVDVLRFESDCVFVFIKEILGIQSGESLVEIADESHV